ncbi:UNVERIFIED_CONTAM: hypothetical protein Slati_2665900 [Sesamum latifolium]|uniref:Uncharacterized protein n=1 Tax=Sesamum latifolium TaxID=2727402 RepID=A0AAW2VZI9_9LAMI
MPGKNPKRMGPTKSGTLTKEKLRKSLVQILLVNDTSPQRPDVLRTLTPRKRGNSHDCGMTYGKGPQRARKLQIREVEKVILDEILDVEVIINAPSSN